MYKLQQNSTLQLYPCKCYFIIKSCHWTQCAKSCYHVCLYRPAPL